MPTIIEPEIQDEELDREIATDLRYTIDRRTRDQLIDNAPAGRYRMAMMSCLSGRWDDLTKDVRRGRITKDQAYQIITEIVDARLTNDLVASEMRERVQNVDVETCATCKSWRKGRCPELARICGMWFDLPTYGSFGCNKWDQRDPVVGWSEGE